MNLLTKMFSSVEKNEVVPLALLFSYAFLNGFAMVLFDTTASTLFLLHYDTNDLPYVYIATAFLSVFVGFLYTKIEEKIELKKLLQIIMIFVFIADSAFFVVLSFDSSGIGAMAMMVFKDTLIMFVGVVFGIISGLIFNIRQSKRLFGMLMSGEILAGIIGGCSVSFLLEIIPTVYLLLISSICLVFSFALLKVIIAKYSNKLHTEQNEDSEISYKALFTNSYYALFFAISVSAFFVFYFIDYIFYYAVENKYTDEKELATFFGLYYAVSNGITLVSSLFLSSKVLNRGIIYGLGAIPLIAISATGSIYIALIISASFVFAIIVILKVLNEVLDVSILTPTFRVLYQPIPSNIKLKVLAFRETIIEPLSMGLAGSVLLVITDIDIVYVLILATSILWIYLAKKLKLEYINELEKMLQKRELIDESVLLSGINEDLMLKGIKSTNPIEVIYYLDLLFKVKYKDIKYILSSLLSHIDKDVVLFVLDKIDEYNKINLLDDLKILIQISHDNNIIDKAILLICKLSTQDIQKDIISMLYTKENTIRKSVLIGLINYQPKSAKEKAIQILKDLTISQIKEEKLISLDILLQTNTTYNIDILLHDQDAQIFKLAIKIVAQNKLIEYVPLLLDNLIHDNIRIDIIIALSNFDDNIIPLLQTALDNTHITEYILKILCNLHSTKADDILLSHIQQNKFIDTIVSSYFASSYKIDDKKYFDIILNTVVQEALFFTIASEYFIDDKYKNTMMVLKEVKETKINDIFYTLGFMYDKELSNQSMIKYNSHSQETKAMTIEHLDNTIENSIKKLILPLLEDTSIQKKIDYYNQFFDTTIYNNDKLIRFLLSNNSPMILTISIIYELANSNNKDYDDLIQKFTSNSNHIIKETAIYALNKDK